MRKLRRPIKRRKRFVDSDVPKASTTEVEEEEEEDDIQDISMSGSKFDMSAIIQQISSSDGNANILPYLMPFFAQYQMMNPVWQRKMRNLQKIAALNAQMQLERMQEEEAARKRKEKSKENVIAEKLIKDQKQKDAEDENKETEKEAKSTVKTKTKKELKNNTDDEAEIAQSDTKAQETPQIMIEGEKLAEGDDNIKEHNKESIDKSENFKKEEKEEKSRKKDKHRKKGLEVRKEEEKLNELKVENRKSDVSVGSIAKRRSERFFDRISKQKSGHKLPFESLERDRRHLFPRYSRRTLDLYKDDAQKVETIDLIINEATTAIKNDQDRLKKLSPLTKLAVKRQESAFSWKTASKADLFQMKTESQLKKRSFFKHQTDQLLADRDFEKKRQESEAHLQELLERMKKTASNFRLQRKFSRDPVEDEK